MDLKEFYADFLEQVKDSAQLNGTTIEQELTSAFIDYIKEADETDSPELIFCESDEKTSRVNQFKINAFDYIEGAGVLDLFCTIYYDKPAIPQLQHNHIDRAISKMTRFLNMCIDGSFSAEFKMMNLDAAEVAELIKEEYQTKNIEQIRFFVISNGVIKEEYNLDDNTITDQNIECVYKVWDIDSVYKSELSGQSMTEIDVDLANIYQSQLECIQMQDENPNINSYLAIMPAITLARIYSAHKTKLIDQNVRNYLGGKIKVNSEIAKTLREKPEMFFAYNNGISSTASAVKVKEHEGRKYITNLRNWHIVNGGQTTNTIFNIFRQKDYLQNLTKAFVTMKVSEIKNIEEAESIVSAIAKSANSQTKINDSDLSANSAFLCEIDKISKKEWTPADSERPNTIWYFERLRGQFLSDKQNEGSSNSAKVKKFLKERPKNQIFSKTDIAKLEMSWNEMPYESSKGSEVCFTKFWKTDFKNVPVDKTYFHELIAKKILFDTIGAKIRESGYNGYANIVKSYVLAIIALKTQKKLNLEYIWHKQAIQPELNAPILDCIKIISEHISAIGEDGKNPSTLAKKVDFWNAIKVKVANVQFNDTSIIKEKKEELSEQEMATIKELKEIDINTLYSLSNWGKSTRKMSIMEKKRIDHVITALEKNAEISFNVAANCLKTLRMARDAGFEL